jgi:hypothetical protein
MELEAGPEGRKLIIEDKLKNLFALAKVIVILTSYLNLRVTIQIRYNDRKTTM